jgi:hypothetical protein
VSQQSFLFVFPYLSVGTMATGQTCCHLAGEMINLDAKAADRGRTRFGEWFWHLLTKETWLMRCDPEIHLCAAFGEINSKLENLSYFYLWNLNLLMKPTATVSLFLSFSLSLFLYLSASLAYLSVCAPARLFPSASTRQVSWKLRSYISLAILHQAPPWGSG